MTNGTNTVSPSKGKYDTSVLLVEFMNNYSTYTYAINTEDINTLIALQGLWQNDLSYKIIT